MTTTLPLRVLIADDEPIARRRLARQLMRAGGVAIVGEAADCDQAVQAVRALRPDLLLLDVQMPGGDGFAVIHRLGDAVPAVIFVTAYDHYALRAFDAAAIDYLTKPVEAPRLAVALDRARLWIAASDRADRIAELQATVSALRAMHVAPQLAPPDLWVKSRSGHQRIVIEQIAYIQAERDYARIFLPDQDHLIPDTIAALSQRLADVGFLRIHRSFLVRRAAIVGLKRGRYGALLACLPDGRDLPIGRSYAARVMREVGLTPLGA